VQESGKILKQKNQLIGHIQARRIRAASTAINPLPRHALSINLYFQKKKAMIKLMGIINTSSPMFLDIMSMKKLNKSADNLVHKFI
jgi:hypothetical protein